VVRWTLTGGDSRAVGTGFATGNLRGAAAERAGTTLALAAGPGSCATVADGSGAGSAAAVGLAVATTDVTGAEGGLAFALAEGSFGR
jgi:hypothetical protein